MLAKRVKGDLIKIQYAQERLGEIESYTLLDLNEAELRKLLQSSKDNKLDKEHEVYIINTKDDKAVIDTWLEIAHDHQLNSKHFSQDVNKKYYAPYEVRAYLFRDQDHHLIKFHLVNKEDPIKKCAINVLGIEKYVVDIYLKQVKASESYKQLGKCTISAEHDYDLYRKWSNYMNKQYLTNIELTSNK